MLFEFDFSTITELPRQRTFLQALVPSLAALEQTEAIWLTGSLARGDADRWSSVDLCLLWQEAAPSSAYVTSPNIALQNSLDKALGAGSKYFAQCKESESSGSLSGICLGAQAADELRCDRGTAGVFFEICWAASSEAGDIGNRNAPARYLYVAEQLAGELHSKFLAKEVALSPPDSREVDLQLGRFWLLLARLPAVLKRRERLAAHALLTELRTLMIDLVVSLNGASRPQSTARINQYLGKAQREAFEKGLGIPQTYLLKGSDGSTNWIGQAVALVVLYRWYAPQLAEKHALPFPHPAEDTVLALLSTEIEGWPAFIATE